ncbi:hypothetical protein K8R30_03535 [archaeon]|nr:hypothetical protein [archaeon]
MVSLKIKVNKKDFIWVGLIVVLLGVGFGYAYGGGNPAIMGHSAGELEIVDTNTNAVTACPNNQFLDGDGSCLTAAQIVAAGGGGISKACTFCLSCGGLWPTPSGRIYSYYAPQGAYGGGCSGTYPATNRWAYLCCK